MPPVVPWISSLVVYPDEALKHELRCPRCLYIIQLHNSVDGGSLTGCCSKILNLACHQEERYPTLGLGHQLALCLQTLHTVASVLGSVAGHFSTSQLHHWRGITDNKRLLDTLEKGYCLQFCRRPLATPISVLQ